MDALDQVSKIPTGRTSRYGEEGIDTPVVDKLQDQAEEVLEEAEMVARRIDWWQVAGYAVTAVAIAGAAVAYLSYRHQQKQPLNRIVRLRDQLGLSDVDFRDLRSTYKRVDFDKINQTGRHLGTAARKATHRGAKKVVELTR